MRTDIRLYHYTLSLYSINIAQKRRINETLHSYFSRQKYWDEEMLKIDYDAVTTDIQDFIIDICMVTMDFIEKYKSLDEIQ